MANTAIREIVEEMWIWLKEDEFGSWRVISQKGVNPITLRVLDDADYEIRVTKKP